MSYAQIICMKCTAEYVQKLDPWGNYYHINAYMCGHCGSREIYKKEFTDDTLVKKGDGYVTELSKEIDNE